MSSELLTAKASWKLNINKTKHFEGLSTFLANMLDSFVTDSSTNTHSDS